MSTLRQISNTCLLIAVLPLTTFAASDTTTFKVDSYIPVLFKDTRWTIGGNLDLQGSTDHTGPDKNYSFIDRGSDYRNQNLSLTSQWQRRHFTLKEEQTDALGLSATYSGNHTASAGHPFYYGGQPETTSDSKLDQYSVRLQYSGEDLNYLFGRFFYSADATGDLSINRTPNDDHSQYSQSYLPSPDLMAILYQVQHGRSERNAASDQFRATAELGAGWGRIYLGNYAATALYMINELRSHAMLTKEPDFKLLDSLTEIIYQNRLKHVVDSRLHRIEALAEVTEYLKSHGVVDASTPMVSVYLQDVWDYFPRDDRPFGIRSRLIIGARRNHTWSAFGSTDTYADTSISTEINPPFNADTTTDGYSVVSSTHSTNDCLSPYLRALLEFEKPVSLRTQFSASLDGHLYTNSKVDEDGWTTHYSSDYDLISSVALDYIIDSRSRVGFLASASCNSQKESRRLDGPGENPETVSRYYEFRYTLSASATYRLNIPTSLNLVASYDDGRSEYPNWDYRSNFNSSHYSLSASINHYIY